MKCISLVLLATALVLAVSTETSAWFDGVNNPGLSLIQSKEAKDAYNRGTALYSKRQFEKAIPEFDAAIAAEPEYFAAYIDRGLCRYELGKYDDAITDFNKAEELNPDHPFPYQNRGCVYFAQRKFEEAEAQFEKALEKDPNYVNAICCRADCWCEKGKLDEAGKEYQRACKLDPKSPLPYLGNGTLYMLRKEYQKALAEFEKAIKIEARFSYIAARGGAYLMLEDYPKALADLDKALKTEPSHVPALTNRGSCFTHQQEYAKAEKDFARADQIDPDSPVILKNRAINFDCWGKFKESLELYDKLMELKPTSEAMVERGQIRMKAGDPKAALEDFDACLKEDGRNPMYHYMRGQALKLSGEYDDAIAAYSQALKLVPSLWGAYTARAGAQVGKKDYAAARKDIAAAQNILTQVVKQQPALAAKLNYDWACSYSVNASAHEDQNDAKTQRANDVKKALEFLKKTVEAKAAHQAHIHWDPEMEPIRNEAGYKALIKLK